VYRRVEVLYGGERLEGVSSVGALRGRQIRVGEQWVQHSGGALRGRQVGGGEQWVQISGVALRGKQFRVGEQWVQKNGGAIGGDKLEKVSRGYRTVEVP
jgi:hypothetical protein